MTNETDTAPAIAPEQALVQVTEYQPFYGQLAELQTQLAGATIDCTTPAGDKIARQSRQALVKLRVAVDAKREELKKPVLERGRLIDSEAKRVIAEVEKLERPIDDAIRAQEARVAEAKAEAERQEAARRKAIEAEIYGLQVLPQGWLQKPAADVATELARVQSLDLSHIPDDYAERAEQARRMCVGQLEAIRISAEQREQAEARLAAEREENERIAREAAERAEAREREHAEQVRQSQERRSALDSATVRVRACAQRAVGVTSARIQQEIDSLSELTDDVVGRWGVHPDDTDTLGLAIAETLGQLRTMKVATETLEAEHRAARERQAKADADAQAEREKHAAEARAEQERLAAQRKALEEQQAKLQAAEDARIQREADEAAKRQRQADAAAKAEQDEREQLARARTEQHIATCGLLPAVHDALELLGSNGYADAAVTRALAAAAERTRQAMLLTSTIEGPGAEALVQALEGGAE